MYLTDHILNAKIFVITTFLRNTSINKKDYFLSVFMYTPFMVFIFIILIFFKFL